MANPLRHGWGRPPALSSMVCIPTHIPFNSCFEHRVRRLNGQPSECASSGKKGSGCMKRITISIFSVLTFLTSSPSWEPTRRRHSIIHPRTHGLRRHDHVRHTHHRAVMRDRLRMVGRWQYQQRRSARGCDHDSASNGPKLTVVGTGTCDPNSPTREMVNWIQFN